jgi:hypothetical protein
LELKEEGMLDTSFIFLCIVQLSRKRKRKLHKPFFWLKTRKENPVLRTMPRRKTRSSKSNAKENVLESKQDISQQCKDVDGKPSADGKTCTLGKDTATFSAQVGFFNCPQMEHQEWYRIGELYLSQNPETGLWRHEPKVPQCVIDSFGKTFSKTELNNEKLVLHTHPQKKNLPRLVKQMVDAVVSKGGKAYCATEVLVCDNKGCHRVYGIIHCPEKQAYVTVTGTVLPDGQVSRIAQRKLKTVKNQDDADERVQIMLKREYISLGKPVSSKKEVPKKTSKTNSKKNSKNKRK